ncbi:MAG: Ca-activated chloride channel [Blastocatellia bacterium]|jgi:VWFA-related protein|nr:Ca-activated chloride channel [Blastocatellia bacterium]
MMHRSLLAVCCLLLAFFSASTTRAQDEMPPPPQPQPQRFAPQAQETIDTIRIDTELVDLSVGVIGHDPQRPVGELQQKDFQVFENGSPQEIAFFASAATPFDLVLLLDLSGSITDKLDLVRKSARRFVEAARPTDRIAIVTFTNEARIVSPLTSDRAELIERIKKIRKPQGGTNFWDALRFALERVLEKKTDGTRRSAVVVMTDGIDNALPDVYGDGSVTSFEELLELTAKSDAIVLPIFLDTEAEMIKAHRWFDVESTFALARRQLGQLAAESGSPLYRARKVEDLNGVYEQVIRDLGTVYSIGYQPANRQRDGAWRSIDVRLVSRPELAVRAKRGYFAK